MASVKASLARNGLPEDLTRQAGDAINAMWRHGFSADQAAADVAGAYDENRLAEFNRLGMEMVLELALEERRA